MHGKIVGAAALVLMSSVSFAEETATGTATPGVASQPSVTATLPKVEGAKITGNLDLRPSVQTSDGLVYSEDAIELGVQFSPGRSITYVQTFFTREPGTDASFVEPSLSPGYLRSKVGKIARIESLGVDISYENRVYVPTWKFEQDRGQIVTFRNYLKFNKDFSPSFSLTLMELPIFHVYSRSGTGTSAAPAFENRVYLIGTWNINDKLSFSMPIMFHATLHRRFAADPVRSDRMSYFLWINPEVSYTLTPKVSIGGGYYSGNLVKGDLSGLSLGDGLGQGVFQLFANVAI